MKEILPTKVAAFFLLILFLSSCVAHRICSSDALVLKNDSTMYAKLLNDSIERIVLNSDLIVCQLQSLNPVDSTRTDSIKTLPNGLNPVIKYLFFEPTNFKSNDIVYGNFSPSVCYMFKTKHGQILYWELDFGLRKWKLLDCNRKELCVSDMKSSNLFILRLTRIVFPNDITLRLLYDNLQVSQ